MDRLFEISLSFVTVYPCSLKSPQCNAISLLTHFAKIDIITQRSWDFFHFGSGSFGKDYDKKAFNIS
jgi:hypothetical protein